MTAIGVPCAAQLLFPVLLFFLTFSQFTSVQPLSLGDLHTSWIRNNCPSSASLPSSIAKKSAGDGSRTFASAFSSFISQVKKLRMNNLRVGPVCNIFTQWVKWVKTLFSRVHCDSGSGKWCTADRNNGKLITDDDLPSCTPYHCKWKGGKKCKFHSGDKDARNNDGKWKRGTCRPRVPCLVTCLRVHSHTWRSPEEYAGKIQQAWGNYIHSASKRDDADDADAEIETDGEVEVEDDDDNQDENKLSTRKWDRKQQSLQWIQSLVDRLSKRGKRLTVNKRFDWNCGSSSGCDICPGAATGAYCKDWDDDSSNCCVCVTWN